LGTISVARPCVAAAHHNEVQAAVNTALSTWGDAEVKKVRAAQKLKAAKDSRRSVHNDRYSTEQEYAAADEKVTKAARALNTAKEEHLEAESAKATAENALALGRSELRGIEIGMDQCVAEPNGTVYHDPQTGLAIDPTAYPRAYAIGDSERWARRISKFVSVCVLCIR
jgi:hypothetical protein